MPLPDATVPSPPAGPPPFPGELAERLRPLRLSRLGPREVLYQEGARADCVYRVVAGLVKLVNHLPDGRARIVRLLSAGQFLGFEGLFGDTYDQMAVAVGDVRVHRIPMAALRRLKEGEPALYCRLLEAWLTHLGYADTWITQFSTGPIRARVARLVNFLARVEGGSASWVRLLTCEEMAAVLGVTTESVSRTLAEFKRARLLRPCEGGDERYLRDAPRMERAAL
jgi:CRP-like cAMP-binding protein